MMYKQLSIQSSSFFPGPLKPSPVSQECVGTGPLGNLISLMLQTHARCGHSLLASAERILPPTPNGVRNKGAIYMSGQACPGRTDRVGTGQN